MKFIRVPAGFKEGPTSHVSNLWKPILLYSGQLFRSLRYWHDGVFQTTRILTCEKDIITWVSKLAPEIVSDLSKKSVNIHPMFLCPLVCLRWYKSVLSSDEMWNFRMLFLWMETHIRIDFMSSLAQCFDVVLINYRSVTGVVKTCFSYHLFPTPFRFFRRNLG